MLLRNICRDQVLASFWRRVMRPEETFARVKPIFPVVGITRVANVTGLDRIGIPVVVVNRPNGRALAVSQGKGVTLAAAKVSGVMESIEHWHAERIALPNLWGCYEDLAYTNTLADPYRLPRLASSRYHPYAPLQWTEGRDLVRDRSVWVPFELLHSAYKDPMPPGSGCFQASTNGLASGNTLTEATIHALCELIERDALTLWHLREEELNEETRIDLETVADPICRELIACFHTVGVEVGVWEITSDIGVPAFLCRIVQRDGDRITTIRPATGCGCHLVREVALTRALTEAAQSRLTHISGARDDMTRDSYRIMLDPEEQARWLRRIRLGATPRDFNSVPVWQGQSLQDDMDRLLQRLADVGLDEVIVVDLTKPEIGIPVVRAVVPGLEGIDSSPDYLLGARGRAVLGLQRMGESHAPVSA